MFHKIKTVHPCFISNQCITCVASPQRAVFTLTKTVLCTYLSQQVTRLFKMRFFHPPILKGKYGKCKAYGSSFILQKDTLFFLASVVSSHAYSFVLCASVLRYLPLRFLPLSRWLSWWGYTVVRFPHKYIHTYTFSQFAFSNSPACFSDRGGEAEASRGNPCEHTGLKTLSPHLARSGLNPGLSHFNHPA